MSAIGDSGRTTTLHPPKIFSQGKLSTIPGSPSAAQILRQIEVVNGMLAEKRATLADRELQEDQTPWQDVTAVDKAKTKIIEHEITRLERAREYWKSCLHDELERLKKRGASESLLPAYKGDPSAPNWKDNPEKLNIAPPSVYYDPNQTPSPEPNRCWIDPKLPGKAREDALQQEWDKYQARLKYDRERYWLQLKHWAVDSALWEERRRKTIAEGKPFTDTAPRMPKLTIAVPNCPRPSEKPQDSI